MIECTKEMNAPLSILVAIGCEFKEQLYEPEEQVTNSLIVRRTVGSQKFIFYPLYILHTAKIFKIKVVVCDGTWFRQGRFVNQAEM